MKALATKAREFSSTRGASIALYTLWTLLVVALYSPISNEQVDLSLRHGLALLFLTLVHGVDLGRLAVFNFRDGREYPRGDLMFGVALMSLPMLYYSFVAYFTATSQTSILVVGVGLVGVVTTMTAVVVCYWSLFLMLIPARGPAVMVLGLSSRQD